MDLDVTENNGPPSHQPRQIPRLTKHIYKKMNTSTNVPVKQNAFPEEQNVTYRDLLLYDNSLVSGIQSRSNDHKNLCQAFK